MGRRARSFSGDRAPVYSVGQDRETVSPYLGRTLQPVGFEGELQFGLREQPDRRMTLAEFAARWSAGGDAVAFFDPRAWDQSPPPPLPPPLVPPPHYPVPLRPLCN